MFKRQLVNYSGIIQELKYGDLELANLNQKYIAIPATATFFSQGLVAPTVIGTATVRTLDTVSIAGRSFRVGIVSATVAASISSQYFTNANYVIGNGTGLGGFTFFQRFINSDPAAVAGVRQFIGMSSSIAAPTNVEPSTLLNSFGLAQLSTDSTQWYIVFGGTTAQAVIPLGTALGSPNTTNILWELSLYASPLNANIIYKVINVGTGITVTGTLAGTSAVVLPVGTLYLAPRTWRCNNATALAVAYDFSSLIIEL